MLKNRDVKLSTRERIRKYLPSETNYHTTKFFTENLLAIEMRKTEILTNKPVYLKYDEKSKLCYMDIGSLYT